MYAYAYLGGCCAICGSVVDLEFDHVDPRTKASTVSALWTASEDRFHAELNKCQLLCRLHHIEKTVNERYGPVVHGEVNGSRRCGCDLCRDAYRVYHRLEMRGRRSRKKSAQ